MSVPIAYHTQLLFQSLDRFATRLTHEEGHLATQKLFKNVFFAWLFLHTALLVPFHREVWSPEALLVYRYEFDASSLYHWFFNLAHHPDITPYYLVFVVGQLIVLVLGIIGIAPRVMNIIVFLFTMNANNLNSVIMDGGNNLSQLILFYMMFMNTSGKPISNRRPGTLEMALTALSNAAFFVSRVQVAIVYLGAGIFKLNGVLWQKGMALYYILQADSYSHPTMYNLFTTFPWISLVGSYFTMAFQILFPILVWFRKSRPYILLAGVTLHLGISFGMGLFTFGLIMCVVYVLFFPNELSLKILSFFSSHSHLRVLIHPDALYLHRLQVWFTRLDWGHALAFESWKDPETPELRRHRALFPHDALVILNETDRGIYREGSALWHIVAKFPLCVPLVPFFGISIYLGLFQLLAHRWKEIAEGDMLSASSSSPTGIGK